MVPIQFDALDIGGRKQLFIDERFFAMNDGVRLAVNPPIDCGPVVVEDTPWDKVRIYGYTSVLQDPLGDGVHRMYYYTAHKYSTGVAFSKDGINWEKPSLGLYEFDGSRDTNLVRVEDLEGNQVDLTVVYAFLDPNAPPELRFKAFSRAGSTHSKPVLCWSQDGLLWKTDMKILSEAESDQLEMALWDPRIGKYAVYGRACGRSISRTELVRPEDMQGYLLEDAIIRADHFDNYESWLDGPILMSKPGIENVWKGNYYKYREWDPEFGDSPAFTSKREWADGVGVYEPGVTVYPYAQDAYICLLPMFYYKPNLFEVQLAVSRDGIRWLRPGDRQPWYWPPLEDEKGIHCMHVGPGLIRNGNEIFHYIGCNTNWHGSVSPEDCVLDTPPDYPRKTEINRVKLRLDGYMSADAGNRECTFLTPPMVFEGSKLALNVNTSASGHMKVELMDARTSRGTSLPADLVNHSENYSSPGRGVAARGFKMADCERITANSCSRAARWNGSPDVSAWRGKPIRLRVTMRNTKLFSFQFID